MATRDITIPLRIQAFLDDARKAVQALRGDLKELATDGDKTGKALAGAGKAPAAAATPSTASRTPASSSTAQAGASTSPQPIRATTDAINDQTEATRKNTSAKRENAAATDAAGAAAGRTTARVRQARTAVNEYGISAGQTTNALRQLPAQFTDIFTSLAGGQNPLLVLIQQGGQIKDSFGGAMPAMRGLLGLITPSRLAVAGLGAVVVALGVAWRTAVNQQNEFNRSVTLGGNAAGVTASQLKRTADQVGASIGGAQRQAAEVATQLATSGRVGADGLGLMTEAAIRLERAGGQSAEKSVQMFAELGKEPVKAALKYNESMNVLTPAIIRQLRALEEQGRQEQAAALAQTTFANAMINRSASVVGSLDSVTKAWNALKAAASGAIDKTVAMFGDPSIEEQIKKQADLVGNLEKKIADRRARGQPLQNLPGMLGAASTRLQDLNQDKAEKEASARATGELAAHTERYNKAVDNTSKLIDKGLPKQEQYRRALEKYEKDIAVRQAGDGQDGGDKLTPAQIAAGRASLRREIFGEGAAGSAFREASAEAGIALARLKADMAVLQAAINANDAIVLQALKDGTTSIDQAYQDRLANIQQENAAQRETLLAEIAETEKALALAKTAAERAPLTQKKIELQAQVRVLETSLSEATRTLLVWKTEQERELASITAKVRIDAATIRGGFDRQAVEDQLRLQLEQDAKRIATIADPAERAAAEQRLQLIFRAGVAQAEFNAKLAESQRIQEALAVKEGEVQALLQQGVIGQVEAEARLRNLRAQQVPVLLEIAGQLDTIRAALPAEAAAIFDQMAAAIGRLRNETKAATPVIVTAGQRIRNTMIDGVADAAATAITNYKSLREVVAGTLRQIAGDIIRSNIKKILTDQFTPGSSGGGGGGGLIQAGIKFVRSIFGFAEGGLIKGPGTPTSDSIPALVNGRTPIAVSTDEFIQPHRAVKHYGVGFMEAVRTLKLPRPAFAFGGLVQAHRQAQFATGGPASNAMVGGGVNVKVELVNTGTPQRVRQKTESFDGKDAVVRLFLEDVRNGGPMSSAMQGVVDRR